MLKGNVGKGVGEMKCAPTNCSGSHPRIGRGLCRNTWSLSGQQREAWQFRDVSACSPPPSSVRKVTVVTPPW